MPRIVLKFLIQCIEHVVYIFIVTGASFIVFNGALKSTTDVKAKVSIVEGNYNVVITRLSLFYWV